MIELYHFGFSTCSQKVRLVLAEKGLDFVSHEVDLLGGAQHDPEYVKLNPNHVVPTLVHDGTALIESTLINEYLDDAFPAAPMRPSDPRGRHSVRLWTKLLDEKVQAAIAVVTFAIGPRNFLLQQPAEVRDANIDAIPDPAQRAARRSVIERGVEAPEFAGALGTMVALLDQVDAAITPGAGFPAIRSASPTPLPSLTCCDSIISQWVPSSPSMRAPLWPIGTSACGRAGRSKPPWRTGHPSLRWKSSA